MIRKIIRVSCKSFKEKENIFKLIESVNTGKIQEYFFSFPTNEIVIRIDVEPSNLLIFDDKIKAVIPCTIMSASRGKPK